MTVLAEPTTCTAVMHGRAGNRPHTCGRPSPCDVHDREPRPGHMPTHPLARILDEQIAAHSTLTNGDDMVGGVQIVAELLVAGGAYSNSMVACRRLYDLRTGRTRHTTIDRADRILTALNLQDLWYTDTELNHWYTR